MRGTKNSIGSIVYVVMVTNLVTVTLVDIVWTYLIYSLFNGPKVNEYLIGGWICGIFDNVELFPLVHCTYLAHLNNNLKDSNHDVVRCVYQKVRLYPIFLDSVILAELHCDVSPKSHLSGINIYYK